MRDTHVYCIWIWMRKLTPFNAWSLVRGAITGQTNWTPQWRKTKARSSYDVVIVGGGGHGLATAYYLAHQHGLKNIAVIEKAWIGGGNTGRNTTVIRSNYFYPESSAFYDFSLKQYECLGQQLDYNIMFSRRGSWVLAHDPHQRDVMRRSANAMRLNGVDAEFHDEQGVRAAIPQLNRAPRYPIVGGLFQPRAGTARHDAVAWAYARACHGLGVDIVEQCEVTGFNIENGRICAVETAQGRIGCAAAAIAVAGNSSTVAGLAGVKLPIQSFGLQAFVTEPVKPCLDTVVLSPATGAYVSQTDKGEIVLGAGLDLFLSYAQRGSLPWMERAAQGLVELFPQFSRLRFLRQWAGVCDVSPDSSPIIDETHVEGLFVSTGWGTGGFKAIPAGGVTLAHHIATGKVHELAKFASFDRFSSGRLVDEAGAAGIAH